MIVGFLVLAIACFVFWLVFLKLKLLRPTPGWVFGFSVVVLHLFLIFVIGLRFVTPQSANATVVQHTIQLIPRLSEPTLVTAVLVDDNTEVKKGQPLFQFAHDLRSQGRAAGGGARRSQRERGDSQGQCRGGKGRSREGGGGTRLRRAPGQDLRTARARGLDAPGRRHAVGDKVSEAQGAKAEDEGKLAAAELSYESNINGVNTNVANIDAQLQQAQFYLDNTTMKAPEDGRIVNLQVSPGMVSGILRIGGIAALIASADRYLLATYFQENLKYVHPGQFAEIAFNLYPGQIFKGHVDSIWKANGQGQYLPSDEIPKYEPPPPTVPQGQYPVKIIVDDPDQS